jgi:hypothetical protein
MDERFEKIKDALVELREASRNCEKSDTGIRKLIDKYDMIFSSKNINTILTIELAHSLTTKFNIPIQHEELAALVPSLCEQLGMTYAELYPAEEIGKGINNPEHVAYHIVLY